MPRGEFGGGETNPDVPGVDAGGVPVSGELVWKARAEDAEEKLAACEAVIAELESELISANDAVVSTQRRGEIERELTAARAVDLETACLLTEVTIGEMDEPDVALAVRELRSRKPFLFSGGSHGMESGAGYGGGSAMSAVPGSGFGKGVGGLGQLASSARSSGDRNELLRYLRARRGG